MERFKIFGGYKCVLSPEEVGYANADRYLKEQMYFWKLQPDGTATSNVHFWSFNRLDIMKMFSEGLGEYGYGTYDILKKGKVEIVDRKY